MSLTGFSLAEIDFTLDSARERSTLTPDGADAIPELREAAVSRTGDLWLLGRHPLLCGDARLEADVARLVGDRWVDLVFTDPPHNVAIDGHVGGLGSVKHHEFAFAPREMSASEFTAFLTETLGHAARVAKDGAIA